MIPLKAILEICHTQYDILKFKYEFYRTPRPNGYPATGMRGGDICIQFEPGRGTDDILAMALQREMQPMKGRIKVIGDEYGKCFRYINFEEAFIYSYEEKMAPYFAIPLTVSISFSCFRLDISPGLHLDRRWPQTDGFYWERIDGEEYNPAPMRVMKRDETEVAFIRILTPLTHKKPNPHPGMEIGRTYQLEVAVYTDGAPDNLNSIHWEYRYTSNKGEIVIGAMKQKGATVEYTVEPGAVANTVTFYAYIGNRYLGGHLEVFVNPLYRYIGTKQWGKLGGNKLEVLSERRSLESLKSDLDDAGYLRAEYLNTLSEQAVRGIYEGRGNIRTKQVLSNDDNVEKRVIENFYTGKYPNLSFGPTSKLSQKLRINPTFQEYYKRYLDKFLRKAIANRSIETVGEEAIFNLFEGQVNSKPNFSRVTEILNYDYYGLMGGTQAIKVDLDIIQTDITTYVVKTRMYISDWYGADKGDINGALSLKGNMGCLNAFFWLQHHYGYHPFATEITYESIDTLYNVKLD